MFRNLFFAAFLIFIVCLSSSAQVEDAETLFESEPPLTQKDIDVFISKYEVYNYLVDHSEDMTPQAAEAYIKKNTGLDSVHFFYIFFKIPPVYTIMQNDPSGATMDSVMEMVPSYIRANADERALISKNKAGIAKTMDELVEQ